MLREVIPRIENRDPEALSARQALDYDQRRLFVFRGDGMSAAQELHTPFTTEGSAAGALPQAPAAGAPGEPRNESCPQPLAWEEVLAAFREESDDWVLEHGCGAIEGRTIGNGPPLYFLNGLLGSHETYALLAWLLRDEFRCVLFDYPAAEYRRPAPGAAGATIDDVAGDLFAVADAHGDRRFDLFASGFGGLIALAALSQGGGRITRAMIHGGYAHRRLSALERLLIRLGRHCRGRLRILPALRTILRSNHLPWFPPFDQSRYDFLERNQLATPIREAACRAALLRATDLRPRMSGIAASILLLRTEGEGVAATACQQELEAALPRARVEWMHTTGLAPFLTHPHRVAKLVRNFLADRSSDAPSMP